MRRASGIQYGWPAVACARILELLFCPMILLCRQKSRQPTRKILIVEPFNIGDAVSLSVMLDPLQQRFPDASIHLLIKPSSSLLYANDKRVTAVHGFELPWAGRGRKIRAMALSAVPLLFFIGRLRGEKFEIGIDARGDVRSQILLALLGCRFRVGYTNYLCSNIRVQGLLLTHNAGDLASERRALLNLRILRTLGCRVEGAKPRLQGISGMVPPSERPLVVCHVGAGWEYKLWPIGNWVSLAKNMHREFDVDMLFVGGASEAGRLAMLRDALPSTDHCKQTAFPELLAAIMASSLFIGLDSGPAHIAAAMGKTVIALFGPAESTIWAPFGSNCHVVSRQELFPCAPCDQRRCTSSTSTCMGAISTEDVLQKVRQTLPAHFHARWADGVPEISVEANAIPA